MSTSDDRVSSYDRSEHSHADLLVELASHHDRDEGDTGGQITRKVSYHLHHDLRQS